VFGYVRPLQGELKVRELETYKAVYCGLCHEIGRRHGFFARMFLNYDFTFLAMLLASNQEGLVSQRRRCPAHPIRGRMACMGLDGLEIAADESVILTYWKLRDNVTDRGFFSGLPARFLSRLIRPAYRRAASCQPEFDRHVAQCLGELQALERQASPSLDRTADTFARILQAAAPGFQDGGQGRALEQLLYHIGRWIYLVDAWDDLEEDGKSGQYNPISARFPNLGEDDCAYLRTTLRHSLNLASSAYQLTQGGQFGPILENILYLGLPAIEEAVFTGRWNGGRGVKPTTKIDQGELT
jgi:hypothetical protein